MNRMIKKMNRIIKKIQNNIIQILKYKMMMKLFQKVRIFNKLWIQIYKNIHNILIKIKKI